MSEVRVGGTSLRGKTGRNGRFPSRQERPLEGMGGGLTLGIRKSTCCVGDWWGGGRGQREIREWIGEWVGSQIGKHGVLGVGSQMNRYTDRDCCI